MCCRNRAARRAARRGCRNRGWNNGVYQPRQSLIRQIVNHIIETRQQKHALARGEFVQQRALEDGKQEMSVDEGLAREVARSEWEDEKQKMRIEDLGMNAEQSSGVGVGVGIDRVARESLALPSYREALKN